jgi:hypothetical protein
MTMDDNGDGDFCDCFYRMGFMGYGMGATHKIRIASGGV